MVSKTLKGALEVLGDERTDWGRPWKCWMIKERTGGWLDVRLGQFR